MQLISLPRRESQTIFSAADRGGDDSSVTSECRKHCGCHVTIADPATDRPVLHPRASQTEEYGDAEADKLRGSRFIIRSARWRAVTRVADSAWPTLLGQPESDAYAVAAAAAAATATTYTERSDLLELLAVMLQLSGSFLVGGILGAEDRCGSCASP
jgi:hypothetical protein